MTRYFNYRKTDPTATATATTTRSVFERVILGERTVSDAIQRGDLVTNGNARAVFDFCALPVEFPTGLSMVEPQD